MRRRDFIQISSLSLTALLVEGCEGVEGFDIEFKNDMAVGHLVFESHQFPVTSKRQTEYLIIGGGLSGLSAAYELGSKDFLLFELSDVLGGSASGSNHDNTRLCHGAHYDLSYPSNYGEEVLTLLNELEIIKYDTFAGSWRFRDKEYLIPKNRETQTLAHGVFRKSVLPDVSVKPAFLELMKSFSDKMPLPTRNINNDLRNLNEISFLRWLQKKLNVTEAFIEGLDYQMRDDYGAGSNTVSALAGIHYYACRPYYTKPVELFSPPEGNYYFIEKIYNKLPKDQIITSHVVKSIKEKSSGFEVAVIDASKREIIKVNCKKIIFTGQKNGLKYIFPRDYPIFQNITYAPWVVVNFIMKKSWDSEAYWQNEIISDDQSLLGLVDSKAQFSPSEKRRVLTVYYCYQPKERELMSLLEEKKHVFINQTLVHLEAYFKKSLKRKVEKVFVKQMGHAMPIPKPGYLFNDGNSYRSNPNMVYAGVDNGRLPLLFEAIDSGISACKLLS